ncbi:MAG: hypothetical protein R2867_01475 [Caldilineaceae bacterium]
MSEATVATTDFQDSYPCTADTQPGDENCFLFCVFASLRELVSGQHLSTAYAPGRDARETVAETVHVLDGGVTPGMDVIH